MKMWRHCTVNFPPSQEYPLQIKLQARKCKPKVALPKSERWGHLPARRCQELQGQSRKTNHGDYKKAGQQLMIQIKQDLIISYHFCREPTEHSINSSIQEVTWNKGKYVPSTFRGSLKGALKACCKEQENLQSSQHLYSSNKQGVQKHKEPHNGTYFGNGVIRGNRVSQCSVINSRRIYSDIEI